MQDLLEACNEALYRFTGTEERVNRRQVYNDIRFIESEQGRLIPLERIKVGRRIYYRYADRDFSIKKQAINESKANQPRETLSILNRFKGVLQFEWREVLLARIDSAFQ